MKIIILTALFILYFPFVSAGQHSKIKAYGIALDLEKLLEDGGLHYVVKSEIDTHDLPDTLFSKIGKTKQMRLVLGEKLGDVFLTCGAEKAYLIEVLADGSIICHYKKYDEKKMLIQSVEKDSIRVKLDMNTYKKLVNLVKKIKNEKCPITR